MYLYLVRHGESVGNAEKLFFGQWDYPLTCRGWQQAWQVSDKLRAVTFTRCCASDLSRAWETAEVCACGRQLVPEKTPELREQFLGRLEQKSWDQAVDMCGAELDKYLNCWFHSAIPTVERPADMALRVGSCTDRIVSSGEDTLVVAHNGSLTLMLYHLGLIRQQDLSDPRLQFQFGCYSSIRIDGGRAVLEAFNV